MTTHRPGNGHTISGSGGTRPAPRAATAHDVERLAVVVDRVATGLAEHIEGHVAAGPVSWLTLPDHPDDTEPAQARAVLAELLAWMRQVYSRYTDAAAGLPACWMWHPDVVEELLWLMAAWNAAYRSPSGSPGAAGDWHDRYRPGVVRRIKETTGRCSLERHRHRQPDADHHTGSAEAAELDKAADQIAAWWSTSRDAEAPEPTTEHIALAERGYRRQR